MCIQIYISQALSRAQSNKHSIEKSLILYDTLKLVFSDTPKSSRPTITIMLWITDPKTTSDSLAVSSVPKSVGTGWSPSKCIWRVLGDWSPRWWCGLMALNLHYPRGSRYLSGSERTVSLLVSLTSTSIADNPSTSAYSKVVPQLEATPTDPITKPRLIRNH